MPFDPAAYDGISGRYGRAGPPTPPQMPTPANGWLMGQGPFNQQASLYGQGYTPQGQPMAGYLQQSQAMQRYLPQDMQSQMRGQAAAGPYNWQNQSQYGPQPDPWSREQGRMVYRGGPTQNPTLPAPIGAPPQQSPQQMQAARQAWQQSITPEQRALQGTSVDNHDFRASLTPEQIRLQQAAQRTRGQMPGMGAPQGGANYTQLMQALQQMFGGR